MVFSDKVKKIVIDEMILKIKVTITFPYSNQVGQR